MGHQSVSTQANLNSIDEELVGKKDVKLYQQSLSTIFDKLKTELLDLHQYVQHQSY